MNSLKLFSAVVLFGLFHGHCAANNIQIANSVLTGNTGTTAQIQFDLSWENSWRLGSGRWDAAWVFVKYRASLTGEWSHANLNNVGHVAAAGSQIDLGLLTPGTAFNSTTNPVVGVFIYRDAAGIGNLSLPSTQLQWAFAAQGLDISDIAQVQVFAIEMVYVPQGAFFLGSGGMESGSFTEGSWMGGATLPYKIMSEAQIWIFPNAGALWGTNNSSMGVPDPLPAAFPKGFSAFYTMKYELSQQQYVDFLNTLTRTQQNTRTGTDVSGTAITNRYIMSNSSTVAFRNGIRCDATLPTAPVPITFYCDLNGNGTGGETDDGKEIACNYLNWYDLTSYLAWSGLRPMTEFEFEKACRGPLAPVANEYPWGTTDVADTAYSLANAGTTNEGITTNYSTTLGNASYSTTGSTISGPMRVGIFAANGSNSGRVTAGASYYGIMELGGNLWEQTVSIRDDRTYTGMHGNGSSYMFDWPSNSVCRGGAWNGTTSSMQVSDRSTADYVPRPANEYIGGRGVRSSP